MVLWLSGSHCQSYGVFMGVFAWVFSACFCFLQQSIDMWTRNWKLCDCGYQYLVNVRSTRNLSFKYTSTTFWKKLMYLSSLCYFLLYCLCSLDFYFFFTFSPPSLHQDQGSRLWVEGVGCVGKAVGASAGLLSRQGGTGWQPGRKALLKIHCWESDWASAWSNQHTHMHTHREGLLRKVVGVSKPGIKTFPPSFIKSDTTSLPSPPPSSTSLHKNYRHTHTNTHANAHAVTSLDSIHNHNVSTSPSKYTQYFIFPLLNFMANTTFIFPRD